MSNTAATSPGTAADDSVSGTIAWADVNNIKIEDSSNSRVPPTSTWAGLPTDRSIRLYKSNALTGTAKSLNTQLSNGLTYRTYGTSTDLWGATLTAEDVNDSGFGVGFKVRADAEDSHYLKATNFGFSIPTGATINGVIAEVKQTYSGGTGVRLAEVDHIRVTVYYTEGSSVVSPFPSHFVV